MASPTSTTSLVALFFVGEVLGAGVPRHRALADVMPCLITSDTHPLNTAVLALNTNTADFQKVRGGLTHLDLHGALPCLKKREALRVFNNGNNITGRN